MLMLTTVLTQYKNLLHRNGFTIFFLGFKSLSLRQDENRET